LSDIPDFLAMSGTGMWVKMNINGQ
jgi:hypothetical protein